MKDQSYLYNSHMLSHKRKQAKEKKKDNMRKTSKGSSGPLPETHSFFPFLFLCLTKKNKPNLFSLYKSLPFSFSFHNSRIKPLTQKKKLFSHSFLAFGSHSSNCLICFANLKMACFLFLNAPPDFFALLHSF